MKRALAIVKLLLLTLAGAVGLWVLAVIAVLVLPSYWTSRRPPDAELLQRHLGLESTNDFSRIEVKYQPAREWTAWFYLEAQPERIERLLREQHFSREDNSQTNSRGSSRAKTTVRWVAIPAAPPPPSITSGQFYSKSPSDTATSFYADAATNGSQLWVRVHRY